MANQINATRIELTKLKNQLVVAKRGHKLLKDKQDEMIRQLLEIISKNKNLRRNIEGELVQSINIYGAAEAVHSDMEIYEKTLIPSSFIEATFETKNIMGITIPKVSVERQKTALTFSLIDSDANLENSILSLSQLFPKLVELAEFEKTTILLLKEIEKVKRRVNAIEFIMIPELETNIKEITTKLSDADRSNTIRTMKSKEIVLNKTNRSGSGGEAYEKK